MENKTFYAYLEQLSPISYGLEAYLNVALKEVSFKKNQLIADIFFEEFPLIFVTKGTIKTAFDGLKEPGQTFIRFHFQESFIPRIGELDSNDYTKNCISMDESILTVLPLKHEFNLRKLFPEYNDVIDKLHEYQLRELYMYIFQLRFEEGQQRLDRLLMLQPKLFQIASIGDISAAVGVHPHTLSTYRR